MSARRPTHAKSTQTDWAISQSLRKGVGYTYSGACTTTECTWAKPEAASFSAASVTAALSMYD